MVALVPSAEYLAGFFDGEGSVGIYPTGRHDCGEPRYRLAVCVGQSGQVIPDVLRGFLAYGGTINSVKPGLGSKPAWQWRISAEQAVTFLLAIEPFSIEKRAQIRLAIQFQGLVHEAKRLPRRGPDAIRGRRKLDLIRERAVCAGAMKELKSA